ncbi:hypothetical protein SNE40_000640 [Patella caerulea]|uniref:ShKT domain-containing protein n=1 Tax=Patella caerulea TaxID=87958 RepID=A0AAN8QA86_PATCE
MFSLLYTVTLLFVCIERTGSKPFLDDCVDHASVDCELIRGTPVCKEVWVYEYCPVSCGVCGMFIPDNSGGKCEDKDSDCDTIQDDLHESCKDIAVKDTCPKSCGVCGRHTHPPHLLKTSPKPQINSSGTTMPLKSSSVALPEITTPSSVSISAPSQSSLEIAPSRSYSQNWESSRTNYETSTQLPHAQSYVSMYQSSQYSLTESSIQNVPSVSFSQNLESLESSRPIFETSSASITIQSSVAPSYQNQISSVPSSQTQIESSTGYHGELPSSVNSIYEPNSSESITSSFVNQLSSTYNNQHQTKLSVAPSRQNQISIASSNLLEIESSAGYQVVLVSSVPNNYVSKSFEIVKPSKSILPSNVNELSSTLSNLYQIQSSVGNQGEFQTSISISYSTTKTPANAIDSSTPLGFQSSSTSNIYQTSAASTLQVAVETLVPQNYESKFSARSEVVTESSKSAMLSNGLVQSNANGVSATLSNLYQIESSGGYQGGVQTPVLVSYPVHALDSATVLEIQLSSTSSIYQMMATSQYVVALETSVPQNYESQFGLSSTLSNLHHIESSGGYQTGAQTSVPISNTYKMLTSSTYQVPQNHESKFPSKSEAVTESLEGNIITITPSGAVSKVSSEMPIYISQDVQSSSQSRVYVGNTVSEGILKTNIPNEILASQELALSSSNVLVSQINQPNVQSTKYIFQESSSRQISGGTPPLRSDQMVSPTSIQLYESKLGGTPWVETMPTSTVSVTLEISVTEKYTVSTSSVIVDHVTHKYTSKPLVSEEITTRGMTGTLPTRPSSEHEKGTSTDMYTTQVNTVNHISHKSTSQPMVSKPITTVGMTDTLPTTRPSTDHERWTTTDMHITDANTADHISHKYTPKPMVSEELTTMGVTDTISTTRPSTEHERESTSDFHITKANTVGHITHTAKPMVSKEFTTESMTDALPTRTSTETERRSTTYMHTTRATTVKPKPTIGRSCRVCEDPFCELGFENIAKCHPDTPYCMNTINIDDEGKIQLNKKCVGVNECEKKWLHDTAKSQECIHFDKNTLYKNLTCNFCCVTDGCNIFSIPDPSTRYKNV